jgi:hypothetical protein
MPSLTPPELPSGLHPDTLAVRQALPRSVYGEHSEALYLTSSFVQPDAATAARRFAGEEEGYTYTRTSNPTVTAVSNSDLAALEGTETAIGTSSGMSAILLMCLGLLKAGDHVVCSQSMFGSTMNLIGKELARFGVQSSFVPQTDATAWQAAVRPETRLPLCRNAHQSADGSVRHTSARATLPMPQVCCLQWTTALRLPHCSVRASLGADSGDSLRNQVSGRAGPRHGRGGVWPAF